MALHHGQLHRTSLSSEQLSHIQRLAALCQNTTQTLLPDPRYSHLERGKGSDMHLPWINVSVSTASDAMWYLDAYPPPNSGSDNASAQRPSPNIPTGSHKRQASTAGRKISGPSGQTLLLSEESEEQLPLFQRNNISTPPKSRALQRSKASLFAVIIGIDRHADPQLAEDTLGGAVADAEDMRLFLTKHLGVPELQITVLHNERATRQGIVDAISELTTDPRIQKGDPILIFYAGHGSQTDAPSFWTTDDPENQIQMLIPYDFDCTPVESTRDHRKGRPLLDVTLSHLLGDLSEKKGDNITVILDCCHAGSGTRTEENGKTFKIRKINLPSGYAIPKDAFPGIAMRSTAVAEGFEGKGLASHVLLAACMRGQSAREYENRGAFTQALLRMLREQDVDKLTYQDVVERLPDLPMQNPQCEGTNQSRILFNSRVSGPRKRLFPIEQKKSGNYALLAGEAHGITVGAEFAIYADADMPHPLGMMVAKQTYAFTTRMEMAPGYPPIQITETGLALQTRAGKAEDIRLYIELDPHFLGVMMRIKDEMQVTDGPKRGFVVVDDKEAQPDLALTLRDGSSKLVEFEIMDPLCRTAGLTRMPFNVSPDANTLYPILRSAADFYWHLHHSNKTSSIKLGEKISFECIKLRKTGGYDDSFREIWEPDPNHGNLQEGGMITIYVDDDAIYGFKVKNNTSLSLYAALFYFDMSDLGIATYYQPATGKRGNVEPSIPPGGVLTIGYGSSGANAYSFFIRPEQTVDVGYLKLYLSTEHVDYSHVPQPSPFEKRFAARGDGSNKGAKRILWDTVTVAVVQRKRNP